MDLTAQEIRKNNMNKVGLLGTIFTMGKDFYKRGLAQQGIRTIVPNIKDRKRINDIIYEELVRNEIRNESRQVILEIINKVVRRGAQGIILGCTELPFLIKQEDTNVKSFDTTIIHARKALDFAMEGK